MNRLTDKEIISLCHDVQIGTGGMDYADALTAIGEELRLRGSQETPQEAWIPVEQELPPAGLEVLTIMHGYTGKPLIKQDHTTKYEGDWSPIHPCWKNDGMWFMNDREGRTTHWRKTFAPPLPYQEETK